MDNNIITNETGAQRLLGYELDVSHADKGARCSLNISDQHLNRHHMLHGGIISTLIDNAMGATASLTVDDTGRVPFMTVSLSTQFMAPAQLGSVVKATGKVVGGGRSLLFIEGRLEDESGKLIATATGVFKRVRKHTPSGSATDSKDASTTTENGS